MQEMWQISDKSIADKNMQSQRATWSEKSIEDLKKSIELAGGGILKKLLSSSENDKRIHSYDLKKWVSDWIFYDNRSN